MKPIIILPPDTMSPEDIKLLRDNEVCVVVSNDPAKIKYLDPLPAMSSRTDIENAAIAMSRKIFRGELFPNNRGDFAKLYVDCLIKGTPLDPQPLQSEREKEFFDMEKLDELRRLAREEAKAERLAAKKAKAQ